MDSNNSSDSEFLQKLKKIVEANFADENFGVRELAKMSRISRTQLHRKLKSSNNQSVSQFIREVRLNKAKEMLQQDVGTVSEIAYKVGFGSPSYFIKCFHEYFGFPPGVILKMPAENSKNEINSEFSVQNNSRNYIEISETGTTPKVSLFKLLVGLLMILTIIIITIFIYRNVTLQKKSITLEKSIAVLPLKNISDDPEIQHLADGIMEDILNRLSHIEELKVKSRISSEQFRNPEKSLPKIAREMNVSYVLEGSIMNNGDNVRIYIQLIKAKTDNHIWSNEYNQNLTDILNFTSNTSKQIAEELEVVLTQVEIAEIEKNYTENTEAYNLYLLGRYFWHRKNINDFEKCLLYFNQAITLDSTYALAYAGLADAYNTLSQGRKPEYIKKCKEYAEKAISLDYNLAEAHASLGDCISDYLWNWDLAEKELKLAIKLNPNFALAYRYYSDYLNKMGRDKEARNYLNKAMELNSQTYNVWFSNYILHYNEGNFEKALEDCDYIRAFRDDPLQEHYLRFRIYLRMGNDQKIMEEYKKILEASLMEDIYWNELEETYNKSGITGVINWIIEFTLNSDMPDYLDIASYYAYLGDQDATMTFLEKEFENGNRNEISSIKSSFDFKALHQNPRFITLLEKMNLADN